MAAKNFELFIGYLGNGATVCNSAVYEHGDYKTIAHISNAGNIKFYVAPDYIPAEAMQKIQETAEEHRKETKNRLKSILWMQELYPGQADYHRGRIIEEILNYTPWKVSDQFFIDYKNAANQDEKNKVIIKYYLNNF
jgi:hypothetical protein